MGQGKFNALVLPRGICQYKVFPERKGFGRQASFGVQYKAVAVKDKFIIGAALVGINNGCSCFFCQTGKDAEALCGFPVIIRRGGNVYKDLRFAPGQGFNGVVFVKQARGQKLGAGPYVFADGKAQFLPVEYNRPVFVGGFKIARFVKNVIGGKELLGPERQYFPPGYERGAV